VSLNQNEAEHRQRRGVPSRIQRKELLFEVLGREQGGGAIFLPLAA
jgi:hypothetical protein